MYIFPQGDIIIGPIFSKSPALCTIYYKKSRNIENFTSEFYDLYPQTGKGYFYDIVSNDILEGYFDL